MREDVHQDQPVHLLGAEGDDVEFNVILLHGRGATAESMVPLAHELQAGGIRFLIPQAAREYWYPQSAFAPLEANEPDLSSALSLVAGIVTDLEREGFSPRQIALGGFSQGACLAGEYAARNAQRYGGLFLFSGALIGPADTPRDYEGNFEGMPAFIGGSDADPWVAHELLTETSRVLDRLGAEVDFRTYPGMGHTVNQDEVEAVRVLLNEAVHSATA